jgi:hypothetical protein
LKVDRKAVTGKLSGSGQMVEGASEDANQRRGWPSFQGSISAGGMRDRSNSGRVFLNYEEEESHNSLRTYKPLAYANEAEMQKHLRSKQQQEKLDHWMLETSCKTDDQKHIKEEAYHQLSLPGKILFQVISVFKHEAAREVGKHSSLPFAHFRCNFCTSRDCPRVRQGSSVSPICCKISVFSAFLFFLTEILH